MHLLKSLFFIYVVKGLAYLTWKLSFICWLSSHEILVQSKPAAFVWCQTVENIINRTETPFKSVQKKRYFAFNDFLKKIE
jgi:hypothetical protein